MVVELLSHNDSCQLLVDRLGVLRIAAEPPALREIITSCAGLSVALVFVAARAVRVPRPVDGLAGCRTQLFPDNDYMRWPPTIRVPPGTGPRQDEWPLGIVYRIASGPNDQLLIQAGRV
ncbi:hypothetical protein [Dactylosporangium darangshiense]|uniref:Uncharacterized protein n=1 Tax=Dactylosporangium darangshiense TaxID=579108 RepID=A0ABP8DUV1_9ACTN